MSDVDTKIRRLNNGTITIISGVVDAEADLIVAKVLSANDKELLNRALARGAAQIRISAGTVVGAPAFTIDSIKPVYGTTAHTGQTLTGIAVAGAAVAFAPIWLTMAAINCDQLLLAVSGVTLDGSNKCTLTVAIECVE